MSSPSNALIRRRFQVRGIVQGVGFRPFVYTLAHSFGLTGYVFNSSSGVTIEVEGSESSVHEFINGLRHHPPPLAEIRDVVEFATEPLGGSSFSILRSRAEAGEIGQVPADAGTCDACWRDFCDPLNRRYGYPFTNCTHCGPRYSIILNVPYDRASTTMTSFTMCAACQAEYDDPTDRRFHAQPNACALCGPSLALVERGAQLAENSFVRTDALQAMRKARALLREGKILAVKGLGGFLLACDAGNAAAVSELRRRKRRPNKPFALMARDVTMVKTLCAVSAEEETALLHARRPIVVLSRLDGAAVAEGVAPGNTTLGVMLPYTPLHYLLFGEAIEEEPEFPALVMTSGNLSEEPIVIANGEALAQLCEIADWFLLHNRNIHMRVDDSIVRRFAGCERVLRRSRGFAPQAINLGLEMDEVLAFGAELKNTFCLTRGHYAILSQHIGDLENYETIRFFEETLAGMQQLFNIAPRAAAYDLHPGYRSTRMALESGIERKIGVQHHHAHIASCMAENHLRGLVIGVAMDGTGFGTDGKIWGGEFLVADFANFERRAHLRYVPIPGGDAAVRQPWRMARSYLRDSFGSQMPDMACFQAVPPRKLELLDKIMAQQIQTVETSSCGRLFDAVAALAGLATEVTFEGEAAIALEMAAVPGINERYGFEIEPGEPAVLDTRPTLIAVVGDLARGRRSGEVSACFHNTLSVAIVELCSRIQKSDALNRVCLSGGTFQNVYLLERTVIELRRRGFEVFLHATIPANDGGIALGQALIAKEILRKGD